MVSRSSWLWLEELGEVSVASFASVGEETHTEGLRVGLGIGSVEHEDLSRLSSLSLGDIVEVSIATNRESEESSHKPPMALIVHSVGLVPVWELSNVLVGIRSVVSLLHVAVDPTQRDG